MTIILKIFLNSISIIVLPTADVRGEKSIGGGRWRAACNIGTMLKRLCCMLTLRLGLMNKDEGDAKAEKLKHQGK